MCCHLKTGMTKKKNNNKKKKLYHIPQMNKWTHPT